jgi:hypothetical protein
MRIGVLFKPDVANINYRAVSPTHALGRRGHEVTMAIQKPDGSIDARPLLGCDVVHVYRRADRVTVACVDHLRQRGIAITWDNDDDVRLLPPESPQYKKLGGLKGVRDFRGQAELIRRADVVTTTSDYLAQCYREVGAASVVQIENYLNPNQYARAPRQHEGLVIGWVAGREHLADARALSISDVLARIMARHPEVRVVTIGVRLSLDTERYTHHPVISFEHLKDHMRQFDVAIAPLADIPMSYARSNIKVKEYAGAGVPWLASARGPYVGLGPREGGRTVEDHQWEDAVEALITSPLKRMRLRLRAQAWGRSQCIDRHAHRWADVFDAAMASAAGRKHGAGASSLPPRTPAPPR